MPVNLTQPVAAQLLPIAGVTLGIAAANIKREKRKDLLVMQLCEGARVAGVFTKNRFCAAPVVVAREHLAQAAVAGSGGIRALLVNTGNANAGTGEQGMRDARTSCAALAGLLGCKAAQILPFSTGVIMEPLPVARIAAGLPGAVTNMRADNWFDAAEAIMTTDIVAKAISRQVSIDGELVTITGIAKGSGMIHPNMATMLAFIFTDAAIEAPALQALLNAANERSFNAITVDGDTSTSDMALLCATGQAGHAPVSDAGDTRLAGFRAALDQVTVDLAQQIVRDGEGATKFVTVAVTGAASDASAKTIALAIANSPLVKTAIAGEDANWGRIVMAVGKAGEPADREKIAISIGGHAVAHAGSRVPGYDESPIAQHMKGEAIDIAVDVGVGAGAATVWTCDLTHGYIAINADYRS